MTSLSALDANKVFGDFNLGSNSKYICYEFGLSKIIKVYIFDNDSICDVLIIEDNGQSISSKCEKSHLLQWAFDEMPNEITDIQEDPLKIKYQPFFYRLSVLNDSCKIVSSSLMEQSNLSQDTDDRIERLKTFIMQLWSENCIKDN